MKRAIRLEPQELETENFPYRKGRRDRQSDTVKHRLDRAERMLGELAHNTTLLLRTLKRKYKCPSPNGDWSSKWAMSSVERLMKDLEETLSREYPWQPLKDYPSDNGGSLLHRIAAGEIELKISPDDSTLLWREIIPECRKEE